MDKTGSPAGDRSPDGAAGRAVPAWVLTYVFALVPPHYVNDLDRLPPREVVSGRHGPKDLWPLGTPLEWLW